MSIISNILNVYPGSNTDIRSYKVLSEYNITSLVKYTTRNRLIAYQENFLSSNGSTITISASSTNPLICQISGYLIRITGNITISTENPSEPNYIALSLVRESEGDKNLKGTDTNSYFMGLEVRLLLDPESELNEDDELLLGVITTNNGAAFGTVLNRSITRLRAQDIWVVGGTDENNPEGIENDPYRDELNTSKTLDEFLNELILSDGQF